MSRLLSGETPVIVTTPKAVMQTTLSKGLLSEVTQRLSVGTSLDLGAFARSLTDLGYKRVRLVEDSGDFSVRGGIVDVLPFGYEDPLRLEFDGDRIRHMTKVWNDVQALRALGWA